MTASPAADTQSAPTNTAAPRCEAWRACPDGCCQPERCTQPAAWRVSLRCANPNRCDHASDLMLLCADCTAHRALCVRMGDGPAHP